MITEHAEYDFFADLAVSETLEDYQRAVVPFLSQMFRAQSVLVILFHRRSHPKIQFRWIPDVDLQETFDTGYVGLGFMLDPFYQQCWKVSEWDAFLLRKIAPDRFENSEYYASYFEGTNMVDDMGFVARLSQDTAVHLSIGRNSGERRYRVNDLKKFKLYARILSRKLCAILRPHIGTEHTKILPLDEQFHAVCNQNGHNVSRREAEVAALIIQGHSSRSIGLNLGISFHTVKVHRRSLYKKLNISSQNELFGLLTPVAPLG